MDLLRKLTFITATATAVKMYAHGPPGPRELAAAAAAAGEESITIIAFQIEF